MRLWQSPNEWTRGHLWLWLWPVASMLLFPSLLAAALKVSSSCAPAAPSSQILNVGERIIYGRTKDSTLPFSTSSPRIRFSSCWLVTGKYGQGLRLEDRITGDL